MIFGKGKENLTLILKSFVQSLYFFLSEGHKVCECTRLL